MKHYFLLLLIVSISFASVAQNKDEVPFMTKSFASESIKNVESETSGGSITVMGVPAGQAKVEVFIWPNNGKKNSSVSKEEIQKEWFKDNDTVGICGATSTPQWQMEEVKNTLLNL